MFGIVEMNKPRWIWGLNQYGPSGSSDSRWTDPNDGIDMLRYETESECVVWALETFKERVRLGYQIIDAAEKEDDDGYRYPGLCLTYLEFDRLDDAMIFKLKFG